MMNAVRGGRLLGTQIAVQQAEVGVVVVRVLGAAITKIHPWVGCFERGACTWRRVAASHHCLQRDSQLKCAAKMLLSLPSQQNTDDLDAQPCSAKAQVTSLSRGSNNK